MKLTKKQGQKICEYYSLGNLMKIVYFGEGGVNYYFMLQTDKGKFVAQFLGRKFDNWTQDKMKLQFKTLLYLKKKKFPYEIPQPLKNKKNKYISRLDGNYHWVYPMLEGKFYKKYNKEQFKEVAKALAVYHNTVKKLKSNRKDFFHYDWFFMQYKKMKKIKAKNKLDKLMLKHIDYYESLLTKIQKVSFKLNLIVTHSDFKNENILFQNNKITGIIDFDNIDYAPKVKDIALAIMRTNYQGIGWNKLKESIFLRNYKSILTISVKEKKLIIPIIIRELCITFWWYYEGMKKNRHQAYIALKKNIINTKKLEKIWSKK